MIMSIEEAIKTLKDRYKIDADEDTKKWLVKMKNTFSHFPKADEEQGKYVRALLHKMPPQIIEATGSAILIADSMNPGLEEE